MLLAMLYIGRGKIILRYKYDLLFTLLERTIRHTLCEIIFKDDEVICRDYQSLARATFRRGSSLVTIWHEEKARDVRERNVDTLNKTHYESGNLVGD